MKLFGLLILAVFASEKNENDDQNDPKYEKNSIVVKIEEEEYVKVNKKSKHIGVIYSRSESKWRVQRWSKSENKTVSNGSYDDEETAAHASDTLARQLMAKGEQNHNLNFPDDYTEVVPEERRFTSKFIGVTYYKNRLMWSAQRRSKNENTMVSNGYYIDEETAAHASDTLARKLMEKGEQNHKLNFSDDYTEVLPEEKQTSSKHIGVSYNKNSSKWYVARWSKKEKKLLSNGYYDNEETAAHASDALARKLMKNGEQRQKLNFPDDYTEIFPEEKTTTSNYVGGTYHKNASTWKVERRSKKEKKQVYIGFYDNEETAAHASDSLERKLMKNGEQKLKLNFPDDNTDIYTEENQKKKRKRTKNLTLERPHNN